MKSITPNFKPSTQKGVIWVTGFFVLSATLLLSKPVLSSENNPPSTSITASKISTTVPPVSAHELQWIGKRIYANECGSKPENLIHWNKGENFPSLGIGHFIWYGKESNERFVETFPAMVNFVGQYQPPPEWLLALKPLDAPWPNKNSFETFKNTAEYHSLLNWLLATQSQQAKFISQQLNIRFKAFFNANKTSLNHSKMTAEEINQIKQLFNTLMEFKEGRFALIDYANFKGIGANTEAYQGEQWGLVSVLQDMRNRHKNFTNFDHADLLNEFVISAKKRLQKRVVLSPPERGENRWLKGWFKRLDGYIKN